MDLLETELRQAHQSHLSPSSPCVTIEELASFYTSKLPRTKVESIRDHLSSCSKCLEIARDLCQFLGISPPPDEPPRAAGLLDRIRSWVSLRPMPALGYLTALLLTLGLGTFWVLERMPMESNSVRGFPGDSTLELIAPKGDLTEPPRVLEWKPLDSAEHYEAELRDTRLNILWKETKVKETRVSLPEEVIRKFQRGNEYAWRVTALSSKKQRTVSPFANFRIVDK